jgi:glycosyltransferase involved in cell wall biosynthesis
MDGQGAMSDLTVIVPVWDDYVAYLPACLAAIRRQEVGARIVLVDNASTRPLPALADDVGVLRTSARLSAGAARNAGLASVRTRYVAFADADDALVAGTWQFLLERLEANPRLVAAAAQPWWVDEETGARRPAASPRPHVYRHLNGRPRLFSLYLALRMALPTNATIFRTEVVRDAGGYGDANLAEDWSLAAAVSLRGEVEQHARPGTEMLVHRGSLFNRRLSRDEIAGGMRDLRARLRSDPRTPLWLRLMLGPIGLFHALKAVANAAAPAFAQPRTR